MKINKISHCFSFIERFFFSFCKHKYEFGCQKNVCLIFTELQGQNDPRRIEFNNCKKNHFYFLEKLLAIVDIYHWWRWKGDFFLNYWQHRLLSNLNSSLGANMLIKSQFLEKKTKPKNQCFSLMPYLIDSRSSNDLLLHNRFFWYSPMKVLDDAG